MGKRGSSRISEKNGKSGRTSPHNEDEETAARTRPFSYEEIMLRRSNKKLSDDVVNETGNVRNTSEEAIVEKISESFASEGADRPHVDMAPVVEKPVSVEPVKESSRKKESYGSKMEDGVGKGKFRRSDESERMKEKPNKDTRSEAKGDKTDKQVHSRRTVDKGSIDDSRKGSEKKYSRDNSAGKERHVDQSRGKHEREIKRKYQNGNERESKKKYQGGNDEKIRDRNVQKKHDLGRHHVLEIEKEREDWKESSKSGFEELRRKRGRSRSRDRGDRHRLRSLSPRAYKHKSSNLGPHSEISSHSLKDRSARHHSDIDSSRGSNIASSSHYQRHGGSATRLGGYSPRKRRTESAIKTPSPPGRSPEKKSARWDHPTVSEKGLSSSVASPFHPPNSSMSSSTHGMSISVAVASVTRTSVAEVSPISLLTKNSGSIDSIQLTEATRRMRRLYVEDIPSSTSEKTLVESLNNFLLSSGVNHIQGRQPCISCVIIKEKKQALVEFLTPEDALAALSFNGSSFFGSILRIRRPKDFIDVATDDPEKSVAAAKSLETISDVVKDSPNKIFIGGISKTLSSKMLVEIISVFGPLRAFHFEMNEELNEPCAFLEYVDQSVTLKACAGLNGIKLGGRVLTVVQAVLSGSSLENRGNASLYEIPEHAKPLLKQPSQILKLSNVFNLEHMSSLSEQEKEEVLEDVRLECARFGTVKSVKIVKHANNCVITTEASEAVNDALSGGDSKNLDSKDQSAKTDTFKEDSQNEARETRGVEFREDVTKEVTESNCLSYNKSADNYMENKSCQIAQVDKDIGVQGIENSSTRFPEESPSQPNSMKEASEPSQDLASEVTRANLEVADGKKEAFAGKNSRMGTESDAIMKNQTKEQDNGKDNDYDSRIIFEPGCVLVEFGRIEASWMAAHCLHGRVFGDRIISVEYVAPDHYSAIF